MRFSRFGIISIFIVSASISAQTNTATTFLSQVVAKYPAVATQQSITLSGNAQWTAGSLHESGAASLQAASDGSSNVQLSLQTASRTETRNLLDTSRACQWIDSKSVTHQVNIPDCYMAPPWFAPLLLAQPAPSIATMLTISDDGQIVKNAVTTRKITYLTNLQADDETTSKKLTAYTRVSVLYDPDTLLPSSVEYIIHGDKNLNIGLPVRVDYSDYRITSGVPIPYRIDRYVNNALQLSIVVTSASVN
jgi:hypothetical protein